MTTQDCSYIRLAVSESELPKRYISNMEIPLPNEAVYKDYSVIRSKGRGGTGFYGYPNVELFWNYLLPKHAFILRALVDGALATANEIIYCTIDKANGNKISPEWVDFTGVPQQIILEAKREDGRGAYFEDVSLIITNLNVLNDPATGI